MIAAIMDQTNTLKYSPYQKDSPKPPDPITVVPANSRATSLNHGKYTKHGGMWTLKHDIKSPKLYEILIKTQFKDNTALELNNFYNHINICLNHQKGQS